jgi:hypothetical protein
MKNAYVVECETHVLYLFSTGCHIGLWVHGMDLTVLKIKIQVYVH